MVKLLLSLLGMAGADRLRRVASGAVLVALGAGVLGGAAVFGAFAAYQSLLLRLEPWAAAGLIGGVLTLVGACVCWLGTARMRGRPRKRELRSGLPALDAVAPLLGLQQRGDVSPLQLVTIAAVVGFAIGRGR